MYIYLETVVWLNSSPSDISFANIHSILDVLISTNIKDYLIVTFDHLVKHQEWTKSTVLTICESHLLPAMLKSSRNMCKDKVLADTVVAGVFLMLSTNTMESALDIWTNLGKFEYSRSKEPLIAAGRLKQATTRPLFGAHCKLPVKLCIKLEQY